MHCFYCEKNKVSEAERRIVITGSDVNHIKNVLRMTYGEEIMVCDGSGMQYTCKIAEFPAGEVLLDILSAEKAATELPVQLKLYQGLPKKSVITQEKGAPHKQRPQIHILTDSHSGTGR